MNATAWESKITGAMEMVWEAARLPHTTAAACGARIRAGENLDSAEIAEVKRRLKLCQTEPEFSRLVAAEL